MTSIEDKLRELGIDPAWVLCGEVEDLNCMQHGGRCPANIVVFCPGSVIARLIDMVEGMRCCDNCEYRALSMHAEPCRGCNGGSHSNWRYLEST